MNLLITRSIILWQRLRNHSIARNTTWMLVANGGGLLIQGMYFVLISRALSADGYGAVAGALALVFTLVPFAGWGSGNVLIMRVARDPTQFSLYWGNALITIMASGILFTLVAAVLGAWLVPNLPLQLVVILAIAEFSLGRVKECSAQAFQAFERLEAMAQLNLLHAGAKLIAAVLFVALTERPAPELWCIWYLGATMLSGLVGFIWVHRSLGPPKPQLSVIRSSLKEGGYFSLSQASASIYNDIDKTMLARLATLEAAGIYAAAYRAIDMAFAPVSALLYATYARFFQQGATGIRGSIGFAKRLVPFSAAYGLLVALGLLILAPLTPYILGEEYIAAVEAIRLLAFVPFLRSLHYFAADTLTGSGYQGIRSAVQIAIAILNIVLNLVLIPHYSWQGAAWASLASEISLTLVLWSTVWVLRTRSPQIANAQVLK